jgi:hypothetical protein
LPSRSTAPAATRTVCSSPSHRIGRSTGHVKELTIGWIGAVRSSRQPLRSFLRMRNSV